MNPREACKGPSLLTRKKYGAKPSEWERFNSVDLDAINFLEDDNPFNDPFKYHPFKGMAFPPTDYIGPDDPRETDDVHSLKPANALRLQFVYGYTTRNGSRQNLFYNADGNVVYHAAALGIVYNKKTHEQYHFHGHNDDITALDLNPKDGITVVTGQLGKQPKILVWSSRPDKSGSGSPHLPLLCVIDGDHRRAILSLSFSANGEFIASVGFDNSRSIALYRWGKEKKIDKMRIGMDKGHTDEIYQLAFNPVTNHIVAGGKKMLKFFGLKEGAMNDTEKDARAAAKQGQQHTATLSDSESKIWAKKGTFGSELGAQDILSLAFDLDGVTYAGNGDGYIFRFREQATDIGVKAHPLPDGSTGWPAAWKLCRVTALWFDTFRKLLISSGDDGWLHAWDTSRWPEGNGKGSALLFDSAGAPKGPRPVLSFDLDKCVIGGLRGTIVKMDDKELEKADPNRGRAAAAHSIHGNKDGNILVGTVCNEIYELNLETVSMDDPKRKPMCLMQGHFEEMWGLAAHPTKAEVITGAEDETLRVWDLEYRTITAVKPVHAPIRCVAYSPKGEWIAVGVGGGDKSNRANGRWFVLRSNDLTTVYDAPQARHERCSDIKFSPDCRWIAIGNADNGIDVYSVPDGGGMKGWRRVAKFEGHSSFVNHIDWSADSMKLQSNCGAHELLYWKLYDETRDGFRFRPHQEKSSSSMRDVAWATQTCIYGWPVRGVWPEGADGTDINGIARSNTGHREMVVTSDDFGQVKLFRYPCIVPYADNKPYSGHSSHVTNIYFTNDDRWVVSVGGGDCAVFQWEVIREK